MNERKPICLITALVPSILGVFALIVEIIREKSRMPEAGHIGDYNLAAGMAVPFYALTGIILSGLVFASLSLLRKEQFRGIAIFCFIVYIAPILLLATLYLDGLWHTRHLSPSAHMTPASK